jgi:hypothetical protein
MATTIKIKNSATPGSTPSSLVQGEMALNVTDGRLFYGSGSGNDVKEFTGTTIDTGSFVTTSSFNTFTSSYYTDSASFDTRINNISIDTSSLVTTSLFNAFTSSIYTFTSSIQTEVDNLTAQTGSYAVTASNDFIGDQTINGVLTITGSEQCNLHMYSTTAGGGISLRDNTTTDDDQVGIGALGNNLCFRAGGAPAGNMRLLDNGNLGIGNLNPPEKLTVEGNISGSQTGSFAYLDLPGFDFDSNAPSTSLEVQGPITASAITSSGQIYGQVGTNEYTTSNVASTGNYSGDIIKLLSTSTSATKVYYLNKNTWTEADNTAVASSDKLLAIAIGTNSNQGMLLKGLFNLGYDPGGFPGDPVYLDAGGIITSTLPITSGEVVRILGYNVDTNIIYFNPSNDYIELA